MSNIEEQLNEKLKFWGIENFEVEKEVHEIVLAALNAPDIVSVYIDDENGLCIDCSYDKGEE